jgi:hypothetical protein
LGADQVLSLRRRQTWQQRQSAEERKNSDQNGALIGRNASLPEAA